MRRVKVAKMKNQYETLNDLTSKKIKKVSNNKK